MKTIFARTTLAALALLPLSLLSHEHASFAFGGARKGTQGYCAAAPAETVIDKSQVYPINPATLRDRILSSSLDVLTALNQVHTSKDNVNLSRANLMPSVNLSPAAAFSGVGFIATGIEALLPFLVPDNWFALKASKAQLEADKQAYRIAQLNDYATVYSVYLGLVNDMEEEKLLESNVRDWTLIYNITNHQYQGGYVDITARNLALNLLNQAMNQLEGTRVVRAGSLDQVKLALHLDQQQPLEIEPYAVPPSPYEHSNVDQAAEKAYSISPEGAQIQDLLAAGKAGVLNAQFSFITGGTLVTGAAKSGGSSLSLSKATVDIGVHLGFDLGPTIELSKRNVDLLVLREKELVDEFGVTLGTALDQLPHMIKQYETAKAAETSLINNYQTVLKRYYGPGGASLTDLITAREGIVLASAERLAAETQLALTRVILHREFLTDQFAKIPGCDYKELVPAKR